MAEKRLAKEERKEQAQAEAWKYYAKPIEVKLGDETVKYTWVMPIDELRALENSTAKKWSKGAVYCRRRI
jgi:hypothetical protein